VTSCEVPIVNALGLHARAAARFVHLAGGFRAAVRVSRLGREMDGKSIMGLLLLTAAQGTSITISADGPDEREAITTLCGLVERGFDEGPGEAPGRRAHPASGDESCD
jgi:phosphocarrier protein